MSPRLACTTPYAVATASRRASCPSPARNEDETMKAKTTTKPAAAAPAKKAATKAAPAKKPAAKAAKKK